MDSSNPQTPGGSAKYCVIFIETSYTFLKKYFGAKIKCKIEDTKENIKEGNYKSSTCT